MRLSGTNIFKAIELSDKGSVPNRVQVLRVGNFNHPDYGKFSITPVVLSDMKRNFEERTRGVDICFDYYHHSDKDAAAWVTKLELSEDGNELFAEVEWTPVAHKKLSDRELRYFSPDFTFQWKDPESGATHKNILFGGGLTNRPFVKEMQAIVAAETTEKKMNLEQALAKIAEIEAANVKLLEEKTQEIQLSETGKTEAITKLEGDIKSLQDNLEVMKSDNEKLLTEKREADEAKVLSEKNAKFSMLLSEGKACAAQKDSFLSGDMETFIKLSQPLNLKGAGKSESKTDSEDKADKAIKLAEEKVKSDPRISYGEALGMAIKELN